MLLWLLLAFYYAIHARNLYKVLFLEILNKKKDAIQSITCVIPCPSHTTVKYKFMK